MRRVAALVLAAASLAAGCGDDEEENVLEVDRIEKAIAAGVERDNPRTKVVSVTCPKDVEQRKGVRFNCEVRGSKEGQIAQATVTQTDDKGGVRYVVP